MLHGGGRENYKNIIKIDGDEYKLSEKGLDSIYLDVIIKFFKKRLENKRSTITYLDENNDIHSVKITNDWKIRVKLTNMPLPYSHWSLGYFSYHKYISIVLLPPPPSNNEYLLLTIGAEGVWSDTEPVKLEYAVSIPDKISLKCLNSNAVSTIYNCKKKRFGSTRSKKKDFLSNDGGILSKIIFFLLLIKQLSINSENKRQRLKSVKTDLDAAIYATWRLTQKQLRDGTHDKASSTIELVEAISNETVLREAVTALTESTTISSLVEGGINSFMWNTGYIYGVKIGREIRHKFPARERGLPCKDNCTPVSYNCWHFAGIMYKIFTSSKYVGLDFTTPSKLENSLQNWNVVRTSRTEYCCIRQMIVDKGKNYATDIISYIKSLDQRGGMKTRFYSTRSKKHLIKKLY
jgi:hypothetical protein